MSTPSGPPPAAPPPPPPHGGQGPQRGQQPGQQQGLQQGQHSGPTPQQRAAVDGAARKRSASTGQILAGILFVLVIIFIVENTDDVPIRFIAGPKVNLPVYLAILIAAVVGGLIGALLRYRRHRHHPVQPPAQAQDKNSRRR